MNKELMRKVMEKKNPTSKQPLAPIAGTMPQGGDKKAMVAGMLAKMKSKGVSDGNC